MTQGRGVHGLRRRERRRRTACEGIVTALACSSTAQIRRTFSCGMLRSQDRRRVPQDLDILQGGDRNERQGGSEEKERGAVDVPVIHVHPRRRYTSWRRNRETLALGPLFTGGPQNRGSSCVMRFYSHFQV